jgi:N-acetylmuramoyl-L-alanine amidase
VTLNRRVPPGADIVSCRANRELRAAKPANISVILCAVRKFFLPLIFVVAAACFSWPLHAAQASSSPINAALAAAVPGAFAAGQQAQPPLQPENPLPPSQPGGAAQPTPAASALPVIVLDPAHGGTNTGARGANGLAEKDVVLQIARTLQAQLLNHGYRVVMTRTDDSDPSYDDRAAVANSYRSAIFITLHIGSSGKMGTVRTFYDQFWSGIQAPSASSEAPTPGANQGTPVAKVPDGALISWHEAQRPYVRDSHRLADILQLQFTQSFPGSPPASIAVPLRDLRSVAEPAVAIEISNVAAPSTDTLLALSGPLSVAIEKAVQTFWRSYAPETP